MSVLPPPSATRIPDEIRPQFEAARREAQAPEPDFKAKNIQSPKTESNTRIKRIAYNIFSVLFFPLGIVRLLAFVIARIASHIILPAQDMGSQGLARERGLAVMNKHRDYDFKRVSLQTADGVKLDGMVISKKGQADNGRWMLHLNGNAARYESYLDGQDPRFYRAIDELDCSLLVVNYRGVGHSQKAAVTRDGLLADAEACFQYLEHGVEAGEIIYGGWSIGGSIAGHAMGEREVKPGVSYVSLQDRSFSRLSDVAGIFGVLLRAVGWEIDGSLGQKKHGHHQVVTYHRADGIIPDGKAARYRNLGLANEQIQQMHRSGQFSSPEMTVVELGRQSENGSSPDPYFHCRPLYRNELAEALSATRAQLGRA